MYGVLQVFMRSLRKLWKKAMSYIEENLGAPCIVAFMALLILSAIELALGNEDLANKLAEAAYYNLVAGVILQIVSIFRSERKAQERKAED